MWTYSQLFSFTFPYSYFDDTLEKFSLCSVHIVVLLFPFIFLLLFIITLADFHSSVIQVGLIYEVSTMCQDLYFRYTGLEIQNKLSHDFWYTESKKPVYKQIATTPDKSWYEKDF